MASSNISVIRSFFTLGLLLLLGACQTGKAPESEPASQSEAGQALEYWALLRTYPEGKIRTDLWADAFYRQKASANLRRGGFDGEWEALGPKNFGGRTLCLAFHPDNPNIIFAGSASGGLWKTETAGQGAEAWTYIPTGHPVLGVAAIAIDPDDPDVMYIGTGEVYNYQAAHPGVVWRLTRGTYGIGILKTTDGGATWTKSLDWSLSELTGVQDLLINPLRPQTVYAATTEGLYRTYNGGQTWDLIHPKAMAVDLEMHVNDTSLLWVAHGNYLSPERGVYRSQDAGQTFQLLSNGIPTNYSGKTLLATAPSMPDRIYASVADFNASIGLYRSDDKGNTWFLVNGEDVAKYQGWFSHDIAVKPNDPNWVVYTGIDAFVTTDGGLSLAQTSYWYLWFLGLTQPGEPEGPPDFVHADIHATYFHPSDPNTVFLATDGGIFISEDTGLTWEARNGGYQTHQFYANFSNSATDSLFAMGGMQDNASAIYVGLPGWWRVLGGDGMSTAIHPENDSILFGSFQNLNLRRSLDRGTVFQAVLPPQVFMENRAFNGPVEIAPSSPNIVYAGAQRLYRSGDLGNSWQATSSVTVDGSNPILTIAVGPEDPSLIYVSTATTSGAPASVKKSVDGGQTWQAMTGLPDRVAMDIAIHPGDPLIAYIVFSGFGTPHLYQTTDGGQTWEALASEDLPDVPTNTVLIDPLYPNNLYLGNDLGVFASTDAGESWLPLNTGLPDAVLAMHLSISPADRKLRLATHGNGVYQTGLLPPEPTAVAAAPRPETGMRVFPNPARGEVQVTWAQALELEAELLLVDAAGRELRAWRRIAPGATKATADLSGLPAGIYFLVLKDQRVRIAAPVAVPAD